MRFDVVQARMRILMIKNCQVALADEENTRIATSVICLWALEHQNQARLDQTDVQEDNDQVVFQ